MAFQLRIIDAPNVTDPKSADAFLAQERGKPPAWTSKFAAFIVIPYNFHNNY